MIRRNRFFWSIILLALLLVINGCTPSQAPTDGGSGQLSSSFDPENPREYGMNGIYLGQGIKEAIDTLKPTKYEFMDAVTRQSLTVDQLAAGKGTIATGIILLDHAQLMLKVRDGVVAAIMMGGVPEQEAQKFKTNRGVAVYDSVDKVKKLYGDTADGKELIYKGTKYQALFSINEGKVLGFRFDPVQS